MTPQSFDRFTIVRRLPGGGMGRVYEAVDTDDGRHVALKLIDRGSDPDTLQIVAAERLGVELHKRLCAIDPRITAVHEFGETTDYLYIVMEFVEGKDLSELMSEERLGYPFAARIAQDVLDVLAEAHSFRTSINGHDYYGIVHGDIKPRNIRMTTIGQVKVLDFGIAKALSLTRNFTQNMFGSIQYSSPERLGTGEVTISSDLWSVAVVLFEMVARRPYFEAATAPKLEHMIRSYRELRPVPAECPEPLRQILTRALSPDVRLRYRTAQEFASDLRAFRNDQPLAPVYDIEATRRTVGASGGDEETARTAAAIDTADVDTETLRLESETTQRTSSPQPAAAKARSAPAAQLPRPAPRKRAASGIQWRRIGLLALMGVAAALTIVLLNEIIVWRTARTLAHDLLSERIQKLDTAWEQYEELRASSNLGFPLWGAQRALRNRLLAEADRVINEYRKADAPTVMEADWVRARQSASRAMELMPSDSIVRGKLRLIDGHLSRIRGTTRKNARMLQDARDRFDEAAQLMPKSPDPWLGLSRLFVYSLKDVENAESALKEAEKRGHDIGKRETAQLADGYRDRGFRSMLEAMRAVNPDEQRRYLDLARQDFDRARELYESIVPWGSAAENLRKVYDSMQRLENIRENPLTEYRRGH
jgi:serine/threonine-protein kinase